MYEEFLAASSKTVGIIAAIGGIGAIGGRMLASIGPVVPDVLPVMGASVGIGIAIVYQSLKLNRDRALDALATQLDGLQKIIKQQDLDIETCRKAKLELLKANEILEIKIARLLGESGEHAQPTK
jgi:hypothetical protein